VQKIRILHVNYIPSSKYGKAKKIQFQADAVREQNLPIEFLVLNDENSKVAKNIAYQKLELPKNKFLKNLAQKLFRYHYLYQALKLKNDDYDVFILRYPLTIGIGVSRFFKTFGKKLYTEHHTIESGELKTYFQSSHISRLIMMYENSKRKKLMPLCLGVIGVTKEIALHAHSFNPRGSKFMLSNGIFLPEIKSIISPISEDSQSLNILFIASNFANWHGLDRLLAGLNRYQGEVNIYLELAGNIFSGQLKESIKKCNDLNKGIQITAHGIVLGEALDSLYEKADIGISSLAIHRNGMVEACVLKTREYCARGLPFVYAYDDPDLSGNENYALKIPADESPVDIDNIIEFIDRVRNSVDTRITMRNDAAERMSWGAKFKSLYNQISDDCTKSRESINS